MPKASDADHAGGGEDHTGQEQGGLEADITAPPIPWITRKPTSMAPETDSAQPTEASVNTVTPLTKMRLRPK